MDYKSVKEDSVKNREKKLVYIAFALTAIIFVQCIIGIVLFVANRQYKVMYDEALETQINMQNVINSLQENTNDNQE